MKNISTLQIKVLIAMAVVFFPSYSGAQDNDLFTSKHFGSLPVTIRKPAGEITRYRMTAVYINRDLAGNFTGKTRITGDYTTGFSGDSARWNNVFIASSREYDGKFPEGTRQDYIENFTYLPSGKMVTDAGNFKNFPSNPENILSRNLIWDMLTFEIYAWNYRDSLRINEPYRLPDIQGSFNMAEIGTYMHHGVTVCWKGITRHGSGLCAVIDFTAADNKLEMNLGIIKTRGTEQYWGTILVSLETGIIEDAVMYGGTIQEIEVAGMKDKLLVKTIRELEVTRIR